MRLAQDLLPRAQALVGRLEAGGLAQAIVTFASAILLRTVIELISAGDQGLPWAFLFHVTLFYLSIALGLVLLLSLSTGRAARPVASVVLNGFVLLLVAPAVDLAVGGGEARPITYFLPGLHDDLLRRFLTFGGSGELGVSLGMKVEVALVLLGLAVYARIASGSFWRAGLVGLGAYVWIFLHALLIFALFALQALVGQGERRYSDTLAAGFLFGWLTLFAPVMLAVLARRKVLARVGQLGLGVLGELAVVGLGVAAAIVGSGATGFVWLRPAVAYVALAVILARGALRWSPQGLGPWFCWPLVLAALFGLVVSPLSFGAVLAAAGASWLLRRGAVPLMDTPLVGMVVSAARAVVLSLVGFGALSGRLEILDRRWIGAFAVAGVVGLFAERWMAGREQRRRQIR